MSVANKLWLLCSGVATITQHAVNTYLPYGDSHTPFESYYRFESEGYVGKFTEELNMDS